MKLNVENLTDYLLSINQQSEDLLKVLDALTLLHFYQWKQSFHEKLQKEYLLKGLYPSLLLFAYLLLILVYKLSFFPKVLDILGQDINGSFMVTRLNCRANLHILNLVFITVILGCLIYISKAKDLRVMLYIRFHKTKLYQSVKSYWSFTFTLYYLSLYRSGLDSTTIYQVLSMMAIPLPAQWLNSQLEHSYLKGKPWDIEYLDDFLRYTIEQSNTKKELIQNLEKYLDTTIVVLNKKFSRCILFLKGVIIFWIIALISIYYQSIYLPLQILQTL
ncbi:hypothetical protein [Erysipelothrix urinaevulpis]|uniref:hypothetical protein n=1 Tax=Erysipelothrix urinaevulpis TaxID=2683717 RepID=UPI0013568879|nr:hypothetical protein [Erysipelothrix urinaevulpis]